MKAAVEDKKGKGGTDKEVIVSYNPTTGEALGEVPIMSADEVKEAVAKARSAQEEWAKTSLEERAEILKQLVAELVARRDKISHLVSKENGKPPLEALTGEVFMMLEAAEFAVREGASVLKPQRIYHKVMKTVKSYKHYIPYGVVGVITPWNYPFMLTMGPAISAIMGGNGVVIKPSEYTPLVTLEIKDIFDQIEGLPNDLVQVVTGYGETGQALIDSGVDKITFTGSVKTGRKVAAACGERLVPVTLELGGKDPMIVLEDAPLDRAAKCAVWASFCNSGQICASVERILVHESIADRFQEKIVNETKKLRQGDPSTMESEVGSMTNEMQYNIVDSHVEDAKKKGAKVLVGGEGESPFYKPTILTDLTPEAEVVQHETFGPVVALIRVKDDDDAVAKANESNYALTASVWTKDTERGQRMAEKLVYGSVNINDHLSPSGAGEVAWGGFKESGFGKTRGPEGLLEMVRYKHVSEDLSDSDSMAHWYPYTAEKYDRFSEVLADMYADSFFQRLKGMIKLVWLTFRSS